MGLQKTVSANADQGKGCDRTLAQARACDRELVLRAQSVYDAWDESDLDTYAGGGICHFIADAFIEVLQAAGIEASTVCSAFEQHVFVVCRLADGVYSLDLPYSLYEVGSAYSWRKIPNVQFTTCDLQWERIDTDPNRFDLYLED